MRLLVRHRSADVKVTQPNNIHGAEEKITPLSYEVRSDRKSQEKSVKQIALRTKDSQ